MKHKITITLLLFLLLIPLRLPISILFIHFFQWLITLTAQATIPQDVLATNVIITKIVYNIALSAIFLYNIEMFSREKFGRKAQTKEYKGMQDQPIYWWVVPIGILLITFIVVDGISVHDIFFYTKP